MLKEAGKNTKGHSFYKLHVPDEHVITGLEIGIVIDQLGIRIGDGVLSWAEIKKAAISAGVNTL